MVSAIKQKAVVGEDGRIEIAAAELPQGLSVEVIVLVDNTDGQDATTHLLSTQRNRAHLDEALEDLKRREKYIYVDPTSGGGRADNPSP